MCLMCYLGMEGGREWGWIEKGMNEQKREKSKSAKQPLKNIAVLIKFLVIKRVADAKWNSFEHSI